MRPATPTTLDDPVTRFGAWIVFWIELAGEWGLLAARTVSGLVFRGPAQRTLWPIVYEVGVSSLPVILLTGFFIGMVLAVQSYDQLRGMRLETRMGSLIHASLVRELGPVLTAVMLAGRVGCAIAAEIGTMKVTEQIDALRALGGDPIRHLAVPRFVACCLMIPLLTVFADAIGMLGGWTVTTQVLGVSSHFYWYYSGLFITAFDLLTGLFKSLCFGAAIAITSCQCGFYCGAGAEGVGRAATAAFVASFLLILALDLMLSSFFLELSRVLNIFIPVLL